MENVLDNRPVTTPNESMAKPPDLLTKLRPLKRLGVRVTVGCLVSLNQCFFAYV